MPLTWFRSSRAKILCIAQSLFLLLLLPALGRSQSGNEIVYVYDELGRLVAVIDTAGEAAVYSYDAVGNLLSISRYASSTVSIIEFTPNSGSIGTVVTIYGTGFSTTPSQNTVTFNGVAATVASATSTQITTSVPAGATTGPIAVTTPAGATTSGTAFIVGESGLPTITEFTPTIGVSGTAVAITGTNFEPSPENNKTKFNLTYSGITSATTTTIGTNVPSGGTSGRISVGTPAGTAISTNDFFVPPSPYTAADVAATGRMAYGESRTVALPIANKIGLMVFDGMSGQRASIKVTSSTITNGALRIYSPNGAEIASVGFNTGGGYLESPILPSTGTYTILIDPNGTYTGNVTFTLYNATDAFGAITINGASVTMVVTVPGQNAQVTFSGTAGQRVSVGMSSVTIGSSSCCSAYLSLRNPDGSNLLAPMDVGTSGGGSSTVLLPVSGTYTILVDPKTTSVGSATLTLSEEIAGTIEMNGASVPLAFTRVGQNAQITFNANAGQRVSLGMTAVSIGPSSCCSTYVSIKNPDGTTLLAPMDVGTSGGGTNTLTLPAAGIYAISVDPKGASTGNLTLTLTEELTATITIGGPSITLSLSRPGQIAAVSFDGTTGQRVSLGMSNVTIGPSSCCSTYVWINKPDGTTLLSTMDVGTSGGGTISVTLPVTGTYRMFIDPKGASVGDITLTLSEDLAPPISINGPTVAMNFRIGQNARLTFDGTAGQRVSLGMSEMTLGVGYCCDVASVSIYKPDGTVLMSPFGFPNSGSGTASQTLPVAGTYSVVVDPYGTRSGDLTLTLSEDLSPPISINGPAVAMNFSRVGQNARLTFDGTAGQRVSLGMSDLTLGVGYCCNVASVAIYKPDGTVLLSPFGFPNSGSGTPSQTLPVTGTYSIVADPYAARTGNLTLTLSGDLAGPITINGSPVILNFTQVGQNARLTFDGTAGQRISLGMSEMTLGVGYCCDVASLAIYKPDGTVLLSPFGFPNTGSGTASQTLPVTGAYSIVVDPYAARTGNLTLTLSEDLSPPININSPAVVLNFSRVGQNARLTFDGTAGQRVSLGMSEMTLGVGYCCDVASVAIYKPDGTVLLSPFGFPNTGSGTASQTLPVTGTYSIVVDPYAARTGDLTLTLSEDLSPPISINSPPVILDFSRVGQNARLMFAGTAGQRVSLGMSDMTLGVGYCCDVASVAIYKPDGTVLLSPFGFPNTGSGTASQTLPVTGTYSIVVDPYAARIGNLTLTLSEDLSPLITINGSAAVMEFTRAGQNARLTFDGAAGQRVSLGMSDITLGVGYCCDVASVAFHKPDGTVLMSPFGFPNTGAGTESQTLPVTGTYSIVVDPYAARTGNLTLTLSEDLGGTLTLNGSAITLDFSRIGQNARLTFTGTAGQAVTVKGTNNSAGNVNVRLYKPDGTQLTNLSSSSITFNAAVLTLPTTGNYTIAVNPGAMGMLNMSVTSP